MYRPPPDVLSTLEIHDPLGVIRGELAVTLAAALDAQADLTVAIADPGVGSTERVAAALDARERAAFELGRAVLAWYTVGGSLHLELAAPVRAIRRPVAEEG